MPQTGMRKGPFILGVTRLDEFGLATASAHIGRVVVDVEWQWPVENGLHHSYGVKLRWLTLFPRSPNIHWRFGFSWPPRNI